MKNTRKLLVLLTMIIAIVTVTLVVASAENYVDSKQFFAWTFKNGVLTITDSSTPSEVATQMNLPFAPKWNSTSNDYPWYEHATEIEEIIVDTDKCQGSTQPYFFAFLPNLKRVRLPETWVFTGMNFFYGQSVESVALGDDPYEANVWDFSTTAKFYENRMFEACGSNMDITLRIGPSVWVGAAGAKNDAGEITFNNFGSVHYAFFTKTTNITIEVTGGSQTAARMDEFAEFMAAKHAENPNAHFAASVTVKHVYETFTGYVDTNNYYIWELVDKTLTIKDNPENTTAEVARFNFPNTGTWPYNPAPTYGDYAARIEEIIVEPETIQGNIQNYTFAGLANLKRVRLPEAWAHASSSIFHNQKVESIAIGDDPYEANVWDLSNIGLFKKDDNTADATRGLFYGCCADMDITLKISPTIWVGSETFGNLQGASFAFFSRTTSVTIPVDETYTIYAIKDTFESYMEEKYAAEGIVPKSVKVKAPFVYTPEVVITLDGYAVRTEEYNGLRSLFTFNLKYAEEMADAGYTLVEYGATVAIDGGSADPVKALAYSAKNGYTTILEKTDDAVNFAVAVVNIPETDVMTDLLITGYAEFTKDGETVTITTDSKAVNLYEASLEMYKNGLCTSVDEENMVWQAVSAAPGATLTAGTDYTIPSFPYTIMGAEEGATFGDTFTFKNVPTVKQVDSTHVSGKPSTGVVTCTSLGGTLSLYEDANGDYVMIMTGVGQNIPAYGDLFGYAYSSTNYVQYSDYFMHDATEAVDMPNPILTTSLLAKVKYLVLTEGITVLPVGTFTQNRIGVTTTEFNLILPASLAGIQQKAFAWSPLTAIHVNKDGQSALEKGTLDLSNYTGSLDTSFLIQGSRNFTKIHLPAHVNAYTGEAFKNCGSGVSKIWVGDVAEPAAGVADFSAIAELTIGCKDLFAGANATLIPSITTVKLPDATTISTPANAWKGTNPLTIMQETANDDVKAFCTTHNYAYTNFAGTAH